MRRTLNATPRRAPQALTRTMKGDCMSHCAGTRSGGLHEPLRGLCRGGRSCRWPDAAEEQRPAHPLKVAPRTWLLVRGVSALKESIPLCARGCSCARVKEAAVLARKQVQPTLRDQCVAASSRENSTPPAGLQWECGTLSRGCAGRRQSQTAGSWEGQQQQIRGLPEKAAWEACIGWPASSQSPRVHSTTTTSSSSRQTHPPTNGRAKRRRDARRRAARHHLTLVAVLDYHAQGLPRPARAAAAPAAAVPAAAVPAAPVAPFPALLLAASALLQALARRCSSASTHSLALARGLARGPSSGAAAVATAAGSGGGGGRRCCGVPLCNPVQEPGLPGADHRRYARSDVDLGPGRAASGRIE